MADVAKIRKPSTTESEATRSGRWPLGRLIPFGKSAASKWGSEPDPLLEFPSETRPAPRMGWVIFGLGFAATLLAIGAALAIGFRSRTSAPVQGVGQLTVESRPPGADVRIDGQHRGVTPLALAVPAGVHTLELRRKGVRRSVLLKIKPGSEVAHYIDLGEQPAAPGSDFGQLQVASQPAGARVSVDGKLRGVTPVTVADLAAGQHGVRIASDAGSAQRTVLIQPGATSSLIVSMDAPQFGWLAISSPVVMQVFEEDRLLGTTEMERIVVPAGRHDIELRNPTLGYRELRVLEVPPGKAATLEINLPNGKVSLNALPWAEVWVDDRRAGETPLANLGVPIGPHEVLFRHPQFGDSRQSIVVTVEGVTRVSVDLRK